MQPAFRNNEERQYRKTHHKCFSNGRKVSSLFLKDRHPHTNMAKAALNMLTHTSSGTLAKDVMNAVDTGWVTDEDPAELAKRKELEDFQPPLDIVDGAARNGPSV
jgi:NAD(P)-dependent dehydrogenase (short-subunit alcohol dehydrogenase family)